MVARLFFPAFAAHHSHGYHHYLAEIVPFAQKADDDAFRVRSTFRHIEDFSGLCSKNASKDFVRSVETGVAMARAMEAGIQGFWKGWFEGVAAMSARTAEAFAAPKASSLLVYDRSEDDHVLSVRFGNRLLAERALQEIRDRKTG